MSYTKSRRLFSVLLALWAALSCGVLAQQPSDSKAPASPKTVTVASKLFPESRILAEIMSQLLEEHADLKVVRKQGLGGTMVCFQALQQGDVDIYPEYTGTGLVTILNEDPAAADPLRTFLQVSQEFQKRYNLVWLSPFGFNNTYALALRKDVAEELGLQTISDLKPYQESLRVAVSHEFLSRPDGFPGLQKTYGLNFSNIKGMEHSLAYQAVASGKVDLIDAYSTDGELERYDLTLLVDDRSLFPPYHGAAIVRAELLEEHPEVRDALESLAWLLDDEAMRRLNFSLQEEKKPLPEVARDFLLQAQLLGEQGASAPGALETSAFGGSLRETVRLMGEHLNLVGLSLGLAIIVGVPLGILITRYQHISQAVLSVAGIIQTIPSIALLAFFIAIPGLGLGLRSAVLALFLYALLPIVRNTYTGILQVDSKLLEAARGIGLTQREILRIVELPLATPTIMAGIRTSAVINIGVATLAAFIGAGGLGDPIVTGLQLNDPHLILSGAVPAALLAIVVDKSLGLLESRLAPRGSGG